VREDDDDGDAGARGREVEGGGGESGVVLWDNIGLTDVGEAGQPRSTALSSDLREGGAMEPCADVEDEVEVEVLLLLPTLVLVAVALSSVARRELA
jgi:hypothetical protein